METMEKLITKEEQIKIAEIILSNVLKKREYFELYYNCLKQICLEKKSLSESFILKTITEDYYMEELNRIYDLKKQLCKELFQKVLKTKDSSVLKPLLNSVKKDVVDIVLENAEVVNEIQDIDIKEVIDYYTNDSIITSYIQEIINDEKIIVSEDVKYIELSSDIKEKIIIFIIQIIKENPINIEEICNKYNFL